MRVKCKCGANIAVKNQSQVQEDLSHFYGDCSSCGRKWRGTTTLDYEVKSDTNLKIRLLSIFNKFSPEEKESLLDQLDPA